MNFVSFVWPSDDAEVDKLLVSSYLSAIASLSMNVGPRLEEAIAMAQRVVAGNSDERERETALAECWDWLRIGTRIVDLRNREVLEARLAIMLLDGRPMRIDDRLECLSWFVEVIWLLHEDVAVAQQALDASFSAYEAGRSQEIQDD